MLERRGRWGRALEQDGEIATFSTFFSLPPAARFALGKRRSSLLRLRVRVSPSFAHSFRPGSRGELLMPINVNTAHLKPNAMRAAARGAGPRYETSLVLPFSFTLKALLCEAWMAFLFFFYCSFRVFSLFRPRVLLASTGAWSYEARFFVVSVVISLCFLLRVCVFVVSPKRLKHFQAPEMCFEVDFVTRDGLINSSLSLPLLSLSLSLSTCSVRGTSKATTHEVAAVALRCPVPRARRSQMIPEFYSFTFCIIYCLLYSCFCSFLRPSRSRWEIRRVGRRRVAYSFVMASRNAPRKEKR